MTNKENIYTARHLTADLTLALEGYMDINSVPFQYEGTLKDLNTVDDTETFMVTINNKRFKIKVIPAWGSFWIPIYWSYEK